MLADEPADSARLDEPMADGARRTDRENQGSLYGLDDHEHDHVGLLAGQRSDGSPFIELVPARRRFDGTFEVVATPGIAEGCAAGDVIKVGPDGHFTVISRGGNVAIHIWSGTELTLDQIGSLRDRFSRLGGIVEAPATAEFMVATVPVTSGFPAIERTMQEWVGGYEDVDWYFGNVYDPEGQPLNWWAADGPPAPPTGFEPVPPP